MKIPSLKSLGVSNVKSSTNVLFKYWFSKEEIMDSGLCSSSGVPLIARVELNGSVPF